MPASEISIGGRSPCSSSCRLSASSCSGSGIALPGCRAAGAVKTGPMLTAMRCGCGAIAASSSKGGEFACWRNLGTSILLREFCCCHLHLLAWLLHSMVRMHAAVTSSNPQHRRFVMGCMPGAGHLTCAALGQGEVSAWSQHADLPVLQTGLAGPSAHLLWDSALHVMPVVRKLLL